jgi:hypothetical protein
MKMVIFMKRLMVLALLGLMGCAQASDNGEQVQTYPPADPDNPYSLTWQAGGALKIEAEILTPNGCYYAGGPITAGPPEDTPAPPSTVSATLTVGMTEGVCTMALKYVAFEGVIPNVPDDAADILIFELWPAGDPIRTRSIPLPPR